jgi:hypothetical protein
MIIVTCYKCKRKFNLEEQEIADGLAHLGKPNAKYYPGRCPNCHAQTKISLKGLKLPPPTTPLVVEAAAAEEAQAGESTPEEAPEGD